MRALRFVLILDAAVLFLLGALLLLLPGRVERAFGFGDLPRGVHYILGIWGCALLTMGIGYVAAAENPIRNVAWIQVGIARGALECAFGLLCVARAIVTFGQAAFGIVAAALITLAYIILYPRDEPVVEQAGVQNGVVE